MTHKHTCDVRPDENGVYQCSCDLMPKAGVHHG